MSELWYYDASDRDAIREYQSKRKATSEPVLPADNADLVAPDYFVDPNSTAFIDGSLVGSFLRNRR